MSEEDTKDALKEALKEWLDDKFAAFGKWSMAGIFAALLSVLVHLLITSGAWQRVVH